MIWIAFAEDAERAGKIKFLPYVKLTLVDE